MPIQNTQQAPSITRKGSLLLGRKSSVKRPRGHQQSASNVAPQLQAFTHLAAPSQQDDSWHARRQSLEQDQMVSYAVTITGGPATDASFHGGKKERRGVFGRLLHKRTASRPALPRVSETVPQVLTLNQSRARHANRPVHSSSASGLSFFPQDLSASVTPQTQPAQDRETTPWPGAATTFRSPQAGEARIKSPLMSRYNPMQVDPSRQASDSSDKSWLTSTSSRLEVSTKADRPPLRIIHAPAGSLAAPRDDSRSIPTASQAAHPPRKSSLGRSDSDEQVPTLRPSKDALALSLQISSQHHRQRSKDKTMPIIQIDQSPPAPPPKYDEKGNYAPTQPIELVLPEPLNRYSSTFREVLPAKRSSPPNPIRNGERGMPSPKLARPLQSGLAARRNAIPGMLHVMAGKSTTDIHAVLGVVLSPLATPGDPSQSRKSKPSSRLKSPTIRGAITKELPKPLPKPKAQAPHPPGVVMRSTYAHVPSARSSRRQSLVSLAGPVSVAKVYRKKSAHKRKPTGFRLPGAEKLRTHVIGRHARPKPTEKSVSRAAAAADAPHGFRAPQPSSTMLAHPSQHQQREWSEDRGRRQPSPLRNKTSSNPPLDDKAAVPTTHRARPGLAPLLALSSNASRTERQQQHRARAPSRTRVLPLGLDPLAAHPPAMDLAVDEARKNKRDVGRSQEPMARGREVPANAGHQLTAEESVQRMMRRQAEQAEKLRVKVL